MINTNKHLHLYIQYQHKYNTQAGYCSLYMLFLWCVLCMHLVIYCSTLFRSLSAPFSFPTPPSSPSLDSTAAVVIGRPLVLGPLGINQLTRCHGEGWGSIHWCTSFLIKTPCRNCHVLERLIKLLLWSLEANLALPARTHMFMYMCKQTHVQEIQWRPVESC